VCSQLGTIFSNGDILGEGRIRKLGLLLSYGVFDSAKRKLVGGGLTLYIDPIRENFIPKMSESERNESSIGTRATEWEHLKSSKCGKRSGLLTFVQ
jgi:hypothetical protein